MTTDDATPQRADADDATPADAPDRPTLPADDTRPVDTPEEAPAPADPEPAEGSGTAISEDAGSADGATVVQDAGSAASEDPGSPASENAGSADDAATPDDTNAPDDMTSTDIGEQNVWAETERFEADHADDRLSNAAGSAESDPEVEDDPDANPVDEDVIADLLAVDGPDEVEAREIEQALAEEDADALAEAAALEPPAGPQQVSLEEIADEAPETEPADLDPLGLDDLRERIRFPEDTFGQEARELQDKLARAPKSFGRLDQVATWFCAIQGRCPPRDFQRVRLVVFAGDHGVSEADVSIYPAEATAQMAQFILDGTATINVLADIAGASIRLVDMAIDAEDFPGDVSTHKVRRSTNRIDREDALTTEQTREAFAAGVQIADQEVDAGADLLVAGDLGVGNTTSAAVLIGASLNLEPSAVTGRGSGIDDFGWMRKVEIVRDALRRARPHRYDSIELLATAGGADIAAMTGFLVEAAVRCTPVLLDGVVSLAAAMLARDTVYDSASWWYASHRCAEPAHKSAVQSLGLTPVLDLGMTPSQGTGALTALPLIRAAIRTLGETALLPRPEPTVPEWVPDEPYDDEDLTDDNAADGGPEESGDTEGAAPPPAEAGLAHELGEDEAVDGTEAGAPDASEPDQADQPEPDQPDQAVPEPNQPEPDALELADREAAEWPTSQPVTPDTKATEPETADAPESDNPRAETPESESPEGGPRERESSESGIPQGDAPEAPQTGRERG